MTKSGEDFWRLHVEFNATEDAEQTAALHEKMTALWETLPEKDKEEVRQRFKVARGE